MTIYQALDIYQKRRPSFKKSEEYSFYIKNKHLIENYYSHLTPLSLPDNEFDVMRNNVIIYALMNKQIIENEIISLNKYAKENKINQGTFINIIKERTIDLPYCNYSKTRIYIPVFSYALNLVYNKDPEKILVHPYNRLLNQFSESLVDPFDTYGPLLFDSYFSKLINISNDGKTYAFFHYDTNTIYVVNSQGRLDTKIVLFDKFIKRPNYNHMIDRLKALMNAYFSFDENRFLLELVKQQFASNILLKKVNKHYEIN